MGDLRVGICGCGRMGGERARCVAALGAHIEFLFDSDMPRAATLAQRFDAQVGSIDAHSIQSLDAVFVCVPPGYRGEIEKLCTQNGVALFVEKPVGISGAAASEVAQLIQDSGIINAVGYMNRYRKSVQSARATLQRSDVIGFSAQWIGRRYGVHWWAADELSGGPFNEQATHLFDLGYLLFGDVIEVYSQAFGDERVSTLFRFSSGALGTAFYSCEANAKDIAFRVFAHQGSLALTGWDFALTENTIDPNNLVVAKEDIFLEETGVFLDAVRTNDQKLILCSFAEAMKTQSIMDAARRSIRTQIHEPVSVADPAPTHA